jgi:RimJ/RimL family protein N-acetyltransferase
VRLLTQWLSSQGFPAVSLVTMAGNTASERVAERAGFRHTGSHPGTHRGRAVQLNRWLRT